VELLGECLDDGLELPARRGGVDPVHQKQVLVVGVTSLGVGDIDPSPAVRAGLAGQWRGEVVVGTGGERPVNRGQSEPAPDDRECAG
jgi:hypothetical protein